MRLSAVSAFAAVFVLTACATLTADHDQRVELITNPAGAYCELHNGIGRWTIEKTPGSVAVPRGFEPLLIDCALADSGSVSAVIEARTRGRSYGNILLLGLPALVDAGTGAGYEYEPDSLTLELKKPPAAQQ